MKVLFLASLLVLAVVAKNCHNPLFTSRVFQSVGATAPQLRYAPHTQVSSTFCSTLKGAESCCTQATLVAMQTSYENYEAKLKASVDALLEKAVAKCDNLDKAGAKSENVRIRALETIADASDRCTEAALRYTKGMLCMGCAANAEEFIDTDSALLIDASHLAELNDACKEFVQESVAFDKTVESHKATLRSAQPVRVAPCNGKCVEERVKSAANGIFFDVNALLRNNAATPEVVAFINDGYVFRQAAATTTTTTTQTNAAGTTGGKTSNAGDAAAVQAQADAIKGKLNTTSTQVDVYFGSASIMKVMMLPLAILGLVMLN